MNTEFNKETIDVIHKTHEFLMHIRHGLEDQMSCFELNACEDLILRLQAHQWKIEKFEEEKAEGKRICPIT